MVKSLAVYEPFCLKTPSQNTQATYRRVLREFFLFVKMRPEEVTPNQILAWRDSLRAYGQKPATINLKLSVVRSLFEYLIAAGEITLNPASIRLVAPMKVNDLLVGKALDIDQVRRLLAAPDKGQTEGQRDYCLMLVMLRLGLRVAEVSSLRCDSIVWEKEWVLKVKVKGGKERKLPLPDDVEAAIKFYLGLDKSRRRNLRSDKPNSPLFQPLVNYRTLEFNRPLSTRQIQKIVAHWGDRAGIGHLTPHDLRRTAITRALDMGIGIREVQMLSGHVDPKTLMRYDHNRTSLEKNPIRQLKY